MAKGLDFQLRFTDNTIFLVSPFEDIVIVTRMHLQDCNSCSVNYNPKIYNCLVFRDMRFDSQTISRSSELRAFLVRKQECHLI